MMRSWLILGASSALAACAAWPHRGSVQDPEPPESGLVAPDPHAPACWDVVVSGMYYALPDESDYFVPVATADRDALHLEARYQYEDRETGSAWAGWNFGFGDAVRLDGTLMGGAVFGRTQGVAPGYRFTLSYGAFDLFSEGEYLVSTEDHTENFFYNWTELGVAPIDWLRFGAVGQRSKVFESESVVDRGLFVGFGLHAVTLTAYAFNFDDEERFFVFSASAAF